MSDHPPPKRLCRNPGCMGYVVGTLCSKCGEQKKKRQHRMPDRRESASKRGYDRKWRRFRLSFLLEYPLCADCSRPATEVHHVDKLGDGGERLDDENCMALCKACHGKRSGRGE